MELLLVKITFL